MKKKFFENLIFFLVLNLLVKPIYIFGIDRVVQNTVGVEIYGSYFPLLNIVLILQIFLDLGIDNFVRREVSQNQKKFKEIIFGLSVIKLILIFFFILVISLVGISLLKTHEEKKLLLLLLINQSLASFILFIRANLGGFHLFKLEGLISVLDRIFMILICGVLLINPITKSSFKIEWFVWSQFAAYLTTLLLSLFLIVRKTGINKPLIHLERFLPIMQKLLPYTILVLTMAIYYRIDSIFLRFLLPDGQEQAGIYAQSFRILDFLSNYAYIFALILLPMFANLISHNKRADELLKSASLFLIIPLLSVIIPVVFYRYEVFKLLYQQHSSLSADAFAILTISFIGITISYTFGSLLTANGNLKELIAMGLIAMIISIVLNLLLIPKFQVIGAVLSNACAQLFTIIYHIKVAKKKLHIPLNKKLILKIISFCIFIAFSGFLFRQFELAWPVCLIAIISLNTIFAFAIKLFQPAIIFELINLKPDNS